MITHSHIAPAHRQLRAQLWVTILIVSWLWLGSIISNPIHAQRPPTYVYAEILDVRYNAESDLYRLSISLDYPDHVAELIVRLWDERGGISMGDRFFENPDHIVLVELDSSNLRSGTSYTIEVRGVDRFGNQIRLPLEYTNGRPVSTLAAMKITHHREDPKPAEVMVESVTPDFQGSTLFIDINVTDIQRIQSYEGFIVDGAGARIANVGPAEFNSMQLPLPLPPRMAQSKAEQKFTLTLFVTTHQGLRSKPATFEIVIPAASPPTVGQRFNRWLSDVVEALTFQPLFLVAVVIIVLNVTGWLIWQKRRNAKAAQTLRAPHDLPTVFRTSSAPHVPHQLRMEVTKSPKPSDRRTLRITRFPCVLGREKGDINFAGDPHISGKHAQISQSNGRFYLTDLDSRNKTFYNKNQLVAGLPVQLHSGGTIRLGTHTTLRVIIDGAGKR